MKKSHAAVTVLTGLVALAAAVQFTASFAAGTPLTPPLTGTIVPTFNGLNIAATDGTTLNISTDKAELSATKLIAPSIVPVPYPVVFNDNLALAGGGGITAIGLTAGIPNNIKFVDSVPATGISIDTYIPIMNTNKSADGMTQYPVYIADNEGLSIGPDAATPRLNINGQTGYISAPGINPATGLSALVTFADTNGLSISNDSGYETLRISGGTGNIENPSGYPVTIYDDQGLEISDLADNVRFKIDSITGAISNPFIPATGNAPLLLDDKVNITGDISNETGSNPVSISDNMTVSGNVGIGAAPSTLSRLKIENTGTSSPVSTLLELNQNNAVKKWAGMLMSRQGSEKWFMGMNDSNDYLRFRRNTGGDTMINGGTDDMVIDANGNVGIGTATPGRKLEISGADPLLKFSGDPTGEAHSIGLDANGLVFFNDNDNRYDMVISNSGNVGIGKSTPSSDTLLDVGSTSYTGTNAIVARNTHATGATLYVQNAGTGPNIYSDGTGYNYFKGNVGIGTTAPSAKLSLSADGSELCCTDGTGGSAGKIVMSKVLRTNAGALGTALNDQLSLASFGYTAGSNNVAMSVRAKRDPAITTAPTGANKNDWSTAFVGLTMDVDGTPQAGASIWLGNAWTGKSIEVEDDLIVAGHISAPEIGTYYDRHNDAEYLLVAINSSTQLTATCDTGDVAVSCNYGTYGTLLGNCLTASKITNGNAMQITNYKMIPSPPSCAVDFRNNSVTASYCAWIELECWNTDG